MNNHKLIIIGSGPAGLTAAIYAGRANLKPLVIEGKEPGGQLMTTSYVENWPGEKRILGPDLMKKMKEHAQACGASFLDQEIVAVDFSKKPFILNTHRKNILTTDALIIATGAQAKRLHCPGEDTYWAKGVSTCAVCDGAFYRDKKVMVIGGGDTAMEHALTLSNVTNDITIVHILDKLTASYAMQQSVLQCKNINFIFNTTVTAIHGDHQKVTSVTLTDQKTKKSQDVPVDGIFLAVGLKPNTDIFKSHLALNQNGYIHVDNNTKTSVAGIFAAGDVHDFKYRQAITSAGSGCMAALDAERYLKGQRD